MVYRIVWRIVWKIVCECDLFDVFFEGEFWGLYTFHRDLSLILMFIELYDNLRVPTSCDLEIGNSATIYAVAVHRCAPQFVLNLEVV